MDKYLASLVKKGEIEESQVEEVIEEEVVEEIAEAVQAPEPVEEVKEEPEEEIEEVKEEVAEPEPPVKEVKKEEKEAIKHPDIPFNPDEPTSVVDIRIFNIPDIKSPFKIFSGNVIVRNKVSDMTELEYVKPGFGLVKGYTPDLK